MPISRYEIRNEFTLADPELYRAAEKDDPEALLEGVAMAGLVGVLRQLGDLAEFAAEIFHHLHEEVMVTSTRGYSLMTRVQQLEADIPMIEKAFLSQTDHSSFPYNTGVYWHPNLRMDQNLVTQGDLPRFVMDSYEECRGPPRLFLLDKYDVAGAGACLKRYTDPSLFKVEISSFGMTSAAVQRKKKKKGSRWRNGDTTPEVLASHVKLDQLFMKESIENGVSYPARSVKLKRRLNGFPFDSKPGKSYMEKLLEITSTYDKVLLEVSTKSVILPTNSLNESDLEVVGGGLMSPVRERVERKRGPPSPHIQEIILKPLVYKPSEVFMYNKISEAPNSSPDIVAEDNAFSHYKVTGDEDMAVVVEGGFTSYQPDDISSEMENYLDAPSTMESEVDTDSELKVKSDFTSSYINRQQLVSDANEETSDTNEEQTNSHSSDSPFTRNSTESNDGNISSGKEFPIFSSSGSPRTSTENPQSECEVSDAIFPFADIIDILPYHKTLQEDIPSSQLSKSVIYNDACPGTATITDHESDLGQLTSSLTCADQIPTVPHSDLEGVNNVGRYETTPLDQEEKRTSIVMDLQCSPSVSETHSGYNSPRFSGPDHIIDESDNESVHCSFTVSDNLCHVTDSRVPLSTDFLHEHNSDPEDLNLGGSEPSTLNIFNALPQKRESIENLIPNKLDGGVPEIPEDSITKYPDTDNSGDSFTAPSEGGELIDKLVNEVSFAFSDAPCIAEACLGKESEKTSGTSAQNLDSEDYSNSSADKQLGSLNFILLHVEHSHDLHRIDLEFQDRDSVLPNEQRTATETPAVGMLQVFEAELLRTETTCDHVFPSDSTSVESSCCPLETLGIPTGTSDFIEKSKVTTSASPVELEVIESSADPTSLNMVHVLLDAIDSQTQPSDTGVIAISEYSITDSNDVSLSVDLDKMVEESSPCFNDLDGLRNDKSSFLGNHGESYLVERVCQSEAAASVSHTVVCNTMNCDKLESEISDIVPNSNLGLEVEKSLDFVNTTIIDPSLQQNDLGTAQESFQQSGLGNHPADAPSLTIGSHMKKKIALLPNQLDEEFPRSDEINSDPLSLLPINHRKMLDLDECTGHENYVSVFSLVNLSSPPSMSNLPARSNHAIDGSGLLKDSLSLTLPSNHPFSETNQVSLEELPPLPPLPPVQWRMGKLQHASSASYGKTMKHSELSSLGIFPPTTSKDDASSSHDELNQSIKQVSQDIPTKEEKREHSSSEASSAADGKKMKHSELSSLGTSPPTTFKAHTSFLHAELNQSLNILNQDMPTKEEKSEHSSSEASSGSDGKMLKYSELSSLGTSPPITSKYDASSSHEELIQTLNQVSQEMPTKEEKSEHSSSEASSTSDGKKKKENELFSLETSPPTTSKADASSLNAKLNQSLNIINQDMPTKEEKSEHSSSEASSASDSELSSLGISASTTSNDDASTSREELNQSLNQLSQDMPTKEEKSEHNSFSLVASIMMPETIDLQAKTEKDEQLIMPSSNSGSMSLAVEDVSNGGQTVKLPRPRNPLIDAVTAVDKSKLRKVVERVRPEIPKVDERDSILEQIRTKSFNLKPALASRPSIRAPKTNLRVAAILEKANAIRQALVDSDEDEDNWSDS